MDLFADCGCFVGFGGGNERIDRRNTRGLVISTSMRHRGRVIVIKGEEPRMNYLSIVAHTSSPRFGVLTCCFLSSLWVFCFGLLFTVDLFIATYPRTLYPYTSSDCSI